LIHANIVLIVKMQPLLEKIKMQAKPFLQPLFFFLFNFRFLFNFNNF